MQDKDLKKIEKEVRDFIRRNSKLGDPIPTRV